VGRYQVVSLSKNGLAVVTFGPATRPCWLHESSQELTPDNWFNLGTPVKR
jgi:hypothetical protein